MGRRRMQITIDQLDQAVKEIIDEYHEVLVEEIDKVAKRTAEEGRDYLKKDPAGFNTRWGKKKYTSGWRVSEEKTRVYLSYEIHQHKQPTLTHLLEYGHALKHGGRAKAYPHIDPTAEIVSNKFEKEVYDAVRRIE